MQYNTLLYQCKSMSMFIIPYINIEKIESLLNEFSWEMIFQQYKHRSGGGLKHRIISQKVRSLKMKIIGINRNRVWHSLKI